MGASILYTAWASSQSLPEASKSLKRSLNVQMFYFLFLRTVGSHVPFTFILFWVHTDQKRGFKAEGGVERRLIRSPQTYLRCVFSPLNPLCLSLSDSYILLCCSLKLMQRKPQSLRRQQAAACHLFFNADNILSDEGLGLTGRKSLSCGISRHCIKWCAEQMLPLLVGLWHVNSADWQIFPLMYTLGDDERTDA